MIRVLTLLLAVMVMAMSVPATAVMMAHSPGVDMSDCANMPDERGHPALPMAADCQKCCLATLVLPTGVARLTMTPLSVLTDRATRLVSHLATPEPPPPRRA